MERHNSYTLDSEGRIVSVDTKWDLFAIENGAKINVLKEHVLGRNIMEFISGDHVKMWYESVIALAKVYDKTVEREYRCDSNTKKRYMKMLIINIKNGFIRIDHYLLKEESFDIQIEMDFKGTYDNKITRCSLCNKFYYDHRWMEIDDIVKLIDITKISISDVICNDCTIRHLVG